MPTAAVIFAGSWSGALAGTCDVKGPAPLIVAKSGNYCMRRSTHWPPTGSERRAADLCRRRAFRACDGARACLCAEHNAISATSGYANQPLLF